MIIIKINMIEQFVKKAYLIINNFGFTAGQSKLW